MNEPTALSDHPGPLRPPRHPVDQRCVLWWRLRAVVAVTPPVIPTLAVVVFGGDWLGGFARWLAVAFAALLVGYVVVMPQIRFRIHRWEITDEAVYTKSGWLTQQWRIAPLSRIQTVDSTRGPLRQLLGLSSVTVTTASAAGAVDISALDQALAAEVVQYLTHTTQATPEDGT